MFGTSLRRAARIHGNRFAFLCQERSIDWSTLHDRATRLSTGLGRLGIVRGDRLAMLLPNGLVGIELFASTVLSGHVIVPLNFRWSVDELADAGKAVHANGVDVSRAFLPCLHETGILQDAQVTRHGRPAYG